jgi:hypothetical protein
LAALAGCGGSPLPATATVRDSAGVTIVTKDATDRPLSWTVRPVFTLGGQDDGPEAFYQVNADLVALDGADNMTVVDPMAARVHQFAADGSHRWSVGNRGSGPGEFEYPIGVSAGPDGRLLVFDPRRGAILELDSAGGLAGEHRARGITVAVAAARSAEVVEQWRYGDDGRVAQLSALTGTDTVTLVRAPPVRTSTARFEACGPGPASVTPVMLAPELAWYVRDTIIAAATGAEYAVRFVTAEGRVVRVVRRALPARAATVADAEHWAEEHPVVYTRGASECRIPAMEMVEKIGYADSVPAIGALVLTPDGGLWVRRWSVTGTAGPIDVFGAAGDYLGTLPSTFPFPLHVRTDGRMLYAEKDSLDIERLVVAEVVRE